MVRPNARHGQLVKALGLRALAVALVSLRPRQGRDLLTELVAIPETITNPDPTGVQIQIVFENWTTFPNLWL